MTRFQHRRGRRAGNEHGFTLVELMIVGGHHWDLGGHRHPALRERADPGTRGQSASRYPHARVRREHVHRPHGCPAGRPNGPDAGDRERPGTICGALHRHRAHTAPGWLAGVERDLHLHLEQHRDLLDYRQRRRNDDHRSVSGSCAPASPEASRRRGRPGAVPRSHAEACDLWVSRRVGEQNPSRFGEYRRPAVWATYTMKGGTGMSTWRIFTSRTPHMSRATVVATSGSTAEGTSNVTTPSLASMRMR